PPAQRRGGAELLRAFTRSCELEPCKAKTGEEAEFTDVNEHDSLRSPFGPRSSALAASGLPNLFLTQQGRRAADPRPRSGSVRHQPITQPAQGLDTAVGAGRQQLAPQPRDQRLDGIRRDGGVQRI